MDFELVLLSGGFLHSRRSGHCTGVEICRSMSLIITFAILVIEQPYKSTRGNEAVSVESSHPDVWICAAHREHVAASVFCGVVFVASTYVFSSEDWRSMK